MLNDETSVKLMPPPPAIIPATARRLDLREVLILVEEATTISVKDLLTPCRFKHICRARHIYYYAARKVPGRSFKAIGAGCGGKDHQTVWHGVDKVRGRPSDFEPELSRVMAGVDRLLAAHGLQGRTP